METLEFIIAGGETKRYHTWPVVHEQRVDEHSHHVAMLCWLLANKEPSANLLMAALTHDLAEHHMGADISAPAKRSLGWLEYEEELMPFREAWGKMERDKLVGAGIPDFDLTTTEKRTLKLADAMDGCLYCIRERMMGNRLIDTCYFNFISYVQDFMDDSNEPCEREIFNYIIDSWDNANA